MICNVHTRYAYRLTPFMTYLIIIKSSTLFTKDYGKILL